MLDVCFSISGFGKQISYTYATIFVFVFAAFGRLHHYSLTRSHDQLVSPPQVESAASRVLGPKRMPNTLTIIIYALALHLVPVDASLPVYKGQG